MLKDIFKELIILKQKEIPTDVIERSRQLPIDKEKIIVTIGVRRCGKSTMMNLVINQMLRQGISREDILWINFDDERFSNIGTEDLNKIIEAYSELFPQKNIKDIYMFFDEIQMVKGWELFVMRIFKSYCKNVYISGSNADMLSSQLHTALRGWPVEFPLYPLSFEEYCHFKKINTQAHLPAEQALLKQAFLDYSKNGGFPEVVLEDTQTEKSRVLQNYFNTMLFRDLIEHYNIKTSPEILKYFIKRIMLNISKPTSINNIYNDIKSQGKTVSKDSLYGWADYTKSIFLFDRIYKFTHSQIKENSSMPKYYCIDTGIRNATILSQSDDDGILLENIVFNHLKQALTSNEKIYYYKEIRECEFVIQNDTQIKRLIQVCWNLELNKKERNSTSEREINGLLEAAKSTQCDNLSIITYDNEGEIQRDGFTIRIIPVWKWLCGEWREKSV